MNRIEDIDPDFDQTGKDSTDGSIIMVEGQRPIRMGQVDHRLHAGDQKPFDGGSTHQQAMLAAKVFRDITEEYVAFRSSGLENFRIEIKMEFENLLQCEICKLREDSQVLVGLFQPAHRTVNQEGFISGATNRPLFKAVQILPDVGEIKPVSCRPGKIFELPDIIHSRQRALIHFLIGPLAIGDFLQFMADLPDVPSRKLRTDVPRPDRMRPIDVQRPPELILAVALKLFEKGLNNLAGRPEIRGDAIKWLPLDGSDPAFSRGHHRNQCLPAK
ncbi:MAG: hypothetical protein DIKNOCCD_01546 [bacterium]|nr:hypothetical protein [bacterium]